MSVLWQKKKYSHEHNRELLLQNFSRGLIIQPIPDHISGIFSQSKELKVILLHLDLQGNLRINSLSISPTPPSFARSCGRNAVLNICIMLYPKKICKKKCQIRQFVKRVQADARHKINGTSFKNIADAAPKGSAA